MCNYDHIIRGELGSLNIYLIKLTLNLVWQCLKVVICTVDLRVVNGSH